MTRDNVRANRWLRTPSELRELIARVKEQHPLLGVLGAAGVRTRRQGRSYVVANCPFPNHKDSSPSFKVKLSAPDRFYCYGCSASGDFSNSFPSDREAVERKVAGAYVG